MKIEATANDHQQNDSWKMDKMGRFSCSQLHRLMADVKRPMTDAELVSREKGNKNTTITDSSLLSDGAITYIEECISEKLTGLPAKDDIKTYAMQWGIDNEPIAKKIYSTVFECEVLETGYIPFDYNSGGSPDGLVAEDGGIEIKCPGRPTHLRYKRMKTIADLLKVCPEYYWQILGYMIIAKRQWFDFVSYHPHYPGKHQLFRMRIKRSEVEGDIKRVLNKLKIAENQLNLILNSL